MDQADHANQGRRRLLAFGGALAASAALPRAHAQAGWPN